MNDERSSVKTMRPFDWALPYPSRRQPIFAQNIVATSQPLATQAGIAMLQRGGNAVDAALATAISLTVLEPCSNGIACTSSTIRRAWRRNPCPEVSISVNVVTIKTGRLLVRVAWIGRGRPRKAHFITTESVQEEACRNTRWSDIGTGRGC